jgi:hypothetical protein
VAATAAGVRTLVCPALTTLHASADRQPRALLAGFTAVRGSETQPGVVLATMRQSDRAAHMNPVQQLCWAGSAQDWLRVADVAARSLHRLLQIAVVSRCNTVEPDGGTCRFW